MCFAISEWRCVGLESLKRFESVPHEFCHYMSVYCTHFEFVLQGKLLSCCIIPSGEFFTRTPHDSGELLVLARICLGHDLNWRSPGHLRHMVHSGCSCSGNSQHNETLINAIDATGTSTPASAPLGLQKLGQSLQAPTGLGQISQITPFPASWGSFARNR